MKRHLMASPETIGTRSEDGAVRINGGERARMPFPKSMRARRMAAQPGRPLTSVGVWTHTLALTGELTQSSAHALEAEIERLCEGGVTAITLDLRALTHVDPVGIAVISFRSGLCKRRGYEFAVIPGTRFVQRALEDAGVGDVRPCEVQIETEERVPVLAGQLEERAG